MKQHRNIGTADTEVAAHHAPAPTNGAEQMAVRADRNATHALHLLHGDDQQAGVFEQLRELRRAIERLSARAPHPAAMWLLVAFGGVVALQALFSLMGR